MAESGRPIYDLPVVSNEYDVLQFPVDQNNVAKRVYATDLADYFKNTVILENTIQNMDLSVSLTAGEIYDLVKDGQIVLFDSGFLESNSTVSCLFPIHRVEKNGNDYTAFVYVQNDIDDSVYEYAIDKFGGVNLIGESSGGGSSGGGGGTAIGAVLYNMPQNLNEAQKAQARSNIGAISAADVPATGVTSVNGMTGAVTIIAVPAFVVGDIGKTLGVIDDGNGNAVLAWVEGGGSGSNIYVTDDGNGNVTITGVTASDDGNGNVVIAALSATDDGTGAVVVTTTVINV